MAAVSAGAHRRVIETGGAGLALDLIFDGKLGPCRCVFYGSIEHVPCRDSETAPSLPSPVRREEASVALTVITTARQRPSQEPGLPDKSPDRPEPYAPQRTLRSPAPVSFRLGRRENRPFDRRSRLPLALIP